MPSETIYFEDLQYDAMKKLCRTRKCNFSELTRDLVTVALKTLPPPTETPKSSGHVLTVKD